MSERLNQGCFLGARCPRQTSWLAFALASLFQLMCGANAVAAVEMIQACPTDVRPSPKAKPVVYEVEDTKLFRLDTETGERRELPELSGVRSVAQSVLNCDNFKQRRAEPNLLAISKIDGSVWVRGVLWNYNRAADRPRVKKVLDTRGKWLRIEGFKDVVKVVAGETWVGALNRQRQVSVWGTDNGNEFLLGFGNEKARNVPLLQLTPVTVFKFPAYLDVMAFNNAMYGLLLDGQVTAWSGEHICKDDVDRVHLLFKEVCPFIPPMEGGVARMWQTKGKPEECNAEFRDGRRWQWPCDLTRDADSSLDSVAAMIKKSTAPSVDAGKN